MLKEVPKSPVKRNNQNSSQGKRKLLTKGTLNKTSLGDSDAEKFEEEIMKDRQSDTYRNKDGNSPNTVQVKRM